MTDEEIAELKARADRAEKMLETSLPDTVAFLRTASETGRALKLRAERAEAACGAWQAAYEKWGSLRVQASDIDRCASELELVQAGEALKAAPNPGQPLLDRMKRLEEERDAAIESDRINRHLVARLTDERTQAIIDKEHVEKDRDALVERHASLRAASRSLQDRWEETKTERDKEAGEWSREIGPDGKQVRYEPREAQP